MKSARLASVLVVLVSALVLLSQPAAAQLRTAPASPEELEANYTRAIEKRTSDILNALQLSEPDKTAKVHDTIISFYRALRARDAVIDNYFVATGKDNSLTNPARSPYSERLTKPIREMFLDALASYLTSDQVDTVKDKLTYNKVPVTYNAYCEIIPDLKEDEKARIRDSLKEARDAAITGGSSHEKTAIFEKHKDQIDAFLATKGHDVAKATEEWKARQETSSASNAGN